MIFSENKDHQLQLFPPQFRVEGRLFYAHKLGKEQLPTQLGRLRTFYFSSDNLLAEVQVHAELQVL